MTGTEKLSLGLKRAIKNIGAYCGPTRLKQDTIKKTSLTNNELERAHLISKLTKSNRFVVK